MVERSETAVDGTLILAVANTNAVTSQNGPSAGVRATFDQQGRLTNAEDSAPLPVSPEFPVMALSIDLGTIRNTSSPTQAVFALGLVRDPVIEYHKDASQTQTRRPYFFTKWGTMQEAVDAFIADFPSALSQADELDTKIMKDAQTSGTDGYADLVALSLRQTMASIEITVPVTDGKLDASDVKSFMKDVGETGRVNPLGTLYASIPALLYLNPSLIGTLLDPLLEAQALSSYPHAFAAPDLGSQYPKAVRNETDTTALGVDSSSTMLVMALLHARKSGEGALLKRHYSLFKKWADFLVTKSVRPTQSQTSDGLTADGNANLALKGILALHAMSKISEAVGETADVGLYSGKANDFYSEWRTLGFVGGRVVSSYDQTGSWALAYNLDAAKLLGADFIASEIYDSQTAFYRSQLSGGEWPYGIGYDSNDQYKVKSHWLMFTAATMTDNSVRDEFISAIHNRTFMDGITPPFASTWDARSGGTISGRATDYHFAFSVPDVPISLEAGGGGAGGDGGGSSPSASSGAKTSIGAIVGGVVGGLAALLLVALAFILWRRRKNRGQPPEAVERKEVKELPDHSDDSVAPLPVLAAAQPSPRSPASDPSPNNDERFQTQVSPAAPTVFVKSRLPPNANQSTTSVPLPLQSASLSYSSPVSSSGGNVVESNASIRSPLISPSKEQPLGPAPAVTQQQAPAVEGTDDLRAEVVALRREMENLRAQQALSASRGGLAVDADEVPIEPPPSYST
ncbi:glutaminase GtaA [Coprinopsis sp. MPI-PUGE-AT-0042]|nr:glutaminase GtaA [Coprinopsis sp. MPI-PUGE-AT-0042]